jgi:2-keto-3-deoxy-galactonokinase
MQVNPIEVQKHLKGMSYPATKQDVVSTAEQNGADDEVVSQLRGLDQEEFSGPDDVMRALGSS